MSTVIIVDGGLGRTLCMIPALKKFVLESNEDVLILAKGWLWAYAGSGLNVLPFGLPDQLEKVNAYDNVIKPEPYFALEFRLGVATLAEACYTALGLAVPDEDECRPYQPVLANFTSAINSVKPVLVIQPHGEGGINNTRAMTPREIATAVVMHRDTHSIYVVGTKENIVIENVTVLKDMSEGQYIKTVLSAALVIGCDSSAIHIAASAHIPHVAYLSKTAGTPLYSDTKLEVREGYEDCLTNPRL